MSAVGAGAVLDAISRMRRANREMARRRMSRVVRPPKSRQCDTPDRLPYPCYFLCTDCGRLEDGLTGDPMRRDESMGEPGACPHCRAHAWVELGKQSVALAYREAEATDDDMHDDDGRVHGFALGMSTFVLALGVATWLAPTTAVGPVIALSLVLSLLVNRSHRALNRRARPGRARARRWRRPVPRPRTASAVRRVHHGVVEGDAVLRTPLGQEPCVGWVVKVWRDDELLLDEQCHADLEVDGERFESDTVTLDLAPRSILHPKADDEAFVRFMRRRGLSPHDGSLRIYEGRLLCGAPVALRQHRSPQGAGPVLTQAPRALTS